VPKQTQAQIIGREGERWFESVLPPAWTLQRPLDDFGTDAIVAVGNENHMTPMEFGVQIKSSKNFKKTKGNLIVPKIRRDTIIYWSRKFYPTLIVAYDAKSRNGYYEWISNLISRDELDTPKSNFYLHIPITRKLTEAAFDKIEIELDEFHRNFTSAFKSRAEIVPVAASLASFLKHLCMAEMADKSDEEQAMWALLAQTQAHEGVVRDLDRLIPWIDPDSIAHYRLTRFRGAYLEECETLMHDFAKKYQDTETKWYGVKKLPEGGVINSRLIAMLSDCVSGLINHVRDD
jgi:hypothetical protein